jgi:hypothetical protein
MWWPRYISNVDNVAQDWGLSCKVLVWSLGHKYAQGAGILGCRDMAGGVENMNLLQRTRAAD